MQETIGIVFGAGAFLTMLLIIFVKSNLVICPPNEVLIISGRRRTLPDGSAIGYRLIRGGRGFKLPIIESVQRLPLNTIPIEIRISRALCEGIIPINIEGRANVKIAGSEADGLMNAIERFLGRNLMEVAQVAKDTIEGSLRGVLATVTPEQANAERVAIAEKVGQLVSADLRRLGLVLDFIKIQNISDDHGFLEAIGRKKNAEVVKNARIAEATAEAEARTVAAEQKRKGSVAEAEAEMVIADADNRLKVHRAQLMAETNRAEQRARVAGDIARIEEEQHLEAVRCDLNRRRFEADTVIPAEAEKLAAELKARGQAARILENGKATAGAVELMQAQWENGGTRDLFLIQMLPELLNMVTKVVAENLHIEKLTVVDSGNGNGLPQHIKGLTGAAVGILEQLKTTTGIDVPSILQPSGGNGNGTSVPKEYP